MRTHHEAYVTWQGGLESGEGRFELGGGALCGCFDHRSRYGGGFDTTPEEMLGAAYAACYAMALAKVLSSEGHVVQWIRARAEIRVAESERGEAFIEGIELHARGDVGGVDGPGFRRHAETARRQWALSRTLAPATPVHLEAQLAEKKKGAVPS